MFLDLSFDGKIFDVTVLDAYSEPSSFKSAILTSLYSDAKVTKDELVQNKLNDDDQRGFWGSRVKRGDEADDDEIGSKMWLLSRALKNNETLVKAKGYIQEALQWLIRDNYTKKIEVTTSWVPLRAQGDMDIRVKFYKPDGSLFDHTFLWSQIT